MKAPTLLIALALAGTVLTPFAATSKLETIEQSVADIRASAKSAKAKK